MRKRIHTKWIQLKKDCAPELLLLLPCNDGACRGNYFVPLNPNKRGWNSWREADFTLRKLREKGRIVFAAVDSSILTNKKEQGKGALVFEWEIERVRNETGEDYGSPSWRYFDPRNKRGLNELMALTESLIISMDRVQNFKRVFAVVNPRGYFLSLCAAVKETGNFDRFTILETPAHPSGLKTSIGIMYGLIKNYLFKGKIRSGIIAHPSLRGRIEKESKSWQKYLPERWRYLEWPQYIH